MLEIVELDVTKLSPEEFTLLRKNSIGASDSSVVLGAMAAFRTPDDLLQDKLTLRYTEEDQAVADKVNVRKGRDLEPLIIQKVNAYFKQYAEVAKDPCMYRLKDYPYLTVNFDGRIEGTGQPVECKYISPYAGKYYQFDKAMPQDFNGEPNTLKLDSDNIEDCAKFYGIPGYYYVQVQHQLLGANTDSGYLAALNDKDWTLYVFHIPANKAMQDRILTEGYSFWNKVSKLRNV